MRYVDSVLQPGETIRQVATIHWVVFLPGILTLLVALVVYLMVPNTGVLSTIGNGLALILLAASLRTLGWARGGGATTPNTPSPTAGSSSSAAWSGAHPWR